MTWHQAGRWGLIGLTLVLGIIFSDFRLDDSFITYRYARNIASGMGFVYNEGARVLSITNPLYTLVLAAFALVTPNLPVVGIVLSVLGIAVGVWLMFEMGIQEGPWVSIGTGLFFVLFPLFWLTLGLETCLYIMLGLLSVRLYLQDRLGWAGLILGLGTLTRPGMPVLAAVLLLDYILSERKIPAKTLALFFATLTPWIIFGTLYFGSPLPGTVDAKSVQAGMGITGFHAGVPFAGALVVMASALLAHSWLWMGVPPVAALGITGIKPVPERRDRWALLLVGWGIFHVIGYIVLGVAPYRWYFAPLVPGIAALFGKGLGWLASQHSHPQRPLPGREMAAAALIVFLIASGWSLYLVDETPRAGESFVDEAALPMLPTVDWFIYKDLGDWLKENTPEEARIGVAEVGQVGYWAERDMIDYLGLLQPEITASLGRGDIYWWLPHYMPDYIVISQPDGSADLFGYRLEGRAWYEATYVEVDRVSDWRYLRSPFVIYERTVTPGDVAPVEAVAGTYSNGVQVTGLATDFDLADLPLGEPVRLRTEWVVPESTEARKHIALRILGIDGSVAGQTDRTFDLSFWPEDEAFTIYQTFVIADDLPPGAYDIAVGMGDSSDTMEWASISRARVPLNESVPAGLASYTMLFGEQIALTGVGYTSEDDILVLDLAWEAITHPEADYTVFIHVRDTDGEIVTQVDTQPHDGLYPTGIWQPGETIPDQILVDLSTVPTGTYDLFMGLYTLEGGRLVTSDGSDGVLLGTVDRP